MARSRSPARGGEQERLPHTNWLKTGLRGALAAKINLRLMRSAIGVRLPCQLSPLGESANGSRFAERLSLLARAVELAVPMVLVLVAVALWLPVGRQWISLVPPLWSNAGLIGGVALLAAASLAVQGMLLYRTPVRNAEQLTMRLLSTTLIVLVASIVVVLWKYVVWLMPDTWTAQGIFLEATHPGSLVDLYSIHQLDRPTIATPIYPPAYYALLRAALAIFGQSPIVLRWVTVGALMMICGALAAASRRRSSDPWALLAPAVFIAFFPSVTWSGAPTKPEYVACAFAMAGLAVYLKRGFESSMRWAPLSACMFAAALLVKYTVVGAFVAVPVHLLLRRQYWACITFLVMSLGIVAIVYGVFEILTDGGIRLFTIRANAVNPQVLKLITAGVLGILPKAFVVLTVGAAFVLALRAGSAGAPETVVPIALLVSLPLAVLAMGKPGSSPNYFLESVMLGALAIALLVRRSIEGTTRETPALFPAAVLLAMAIIQLPSNLTLVARSEGSTREQIEVRARLAALRPAAGEFVMADTYYVFDVAQAGYTPVMIDNLLYTLMVDNGVIGDRQLLALFESGKVPYLVLQNTLEWHASLGYGDRFYPIGVLKYLKRHYTCETVMKRWDDNALVICSRSHDANSQEPMPAEGHR